MLNTTILMGRLVADPELRHTPNDVAVTSFTLAVERSYVKSGAERQADFIDIVAWRSTAEFVCRYFRKGQLVAVQGSIQTRPYQDKEGNKRKAFEIVADNVYFAEPKRDSSSASQGGGYQNSGYSREANEPAPTHRSRTYNPIDIEDDYAPPPSGFQGAGNQTSLGSAPDDFEGLSAQDDLPF